MLVSNWNRNMKFILLIACIIILLESTDGHGSHHRSSIINLSHLERKDQSSISSEHTSNFSECDEKARCTLPVQCPAHVRIKVKACKMSGFRDGVCCSTGQNHTEVFHEKGRGHKVIRIDPITLGVVSRHSRAQLAELRSREVKLLNAGPSVLIPGSASYSHFRNSRTFNMADLNQVMNVASRALEIAIATRAFKDRQGLTNQQLELSLIQQDLRPTSMGSTCAPMPLCSPVPEKYRRIDGACNNLYHEKWGAALTPYARILPPTYHDGIWAPRASVIEGHPLPSARKISTGLIDDKDVPNEGYTLLVMQFGQFLSHDITQSIDTSFVNGSAISCCESDGSKTLPFEHRHYACMPIHIPEDDFFFKHFKQGCMNFVRSVLAPRQDCTLGYAQQMNKITHFIDGSSIYGSTPEQTGELRSFEEGRLNVFHDFGRDLLPLAKDPNACLTMEQGSACFDSGDTRTNQMISLVVLHTVFLREHNRVAGILHEMNPYWDDEKIFLEARQIVTAELQIIVYKEFLPAVIGDDAMNEFQLNLQSDENYSYDYDPNVEPSILNEFASAAFRFGHSTINGLMKVYGIDRMEEAISIPEVMFHPSRMRKRLFLDQMLSTLTTEPLQEVDNSLSETLTKYMFRGGNPFGVDLASLNIQRGRDHGLRPYNDYRELIGLPKIQSFDEFEPELAERLSKVYRSVDDIDLWVGGLLEKTVPGSILGPVFRDIVAEQFSRLKKGDRYFFENAPSINPGHFTTDQLRELRKVTMSRVICDNSDGILLGRQARNAFRKPGVEGNEFVDCAGHEIPKLDFRFWKE